MAENRWWIATRQALAKPTFVAVTLLLLTCAVGLDAIRRGMSLYFRKEPLPLRSGEKGLTVINTVLRTAPPREFKEARKQDVWVMVPEPHAIDTEVAHNLGTDKYVFRDYVNVSAGTMEDERRYPAQMSEYRQRYKEWEDARRRDPGYPGKEPERPKFKSQSSVEEIEDLKDKNAESRNNRRKRVGELRQGNPCAVVSLAVTYYTGKVDTVPHVPDRCYVADGFRPQEKNAEIWQLWDKATRVGKPEDEPTRIDVKAARTDDESTKIPVQFIVFVDHLPQGNRPEPFDRCVAYFFHVNGNLVGNHTSVRAQLQDLRERYAYFAKVELMMTLPRSSRKNDGEPVPDHEKDEVRRAMTSFLSAVWPEIEKVLPKWDERHRQGR